MRTKLKKCKRYMYGVFSCVSLIQPTRDDDNLVFYLRVNPCNSHSVYRTTSLSLKKCQFVLLLFMYMYMYMYMYKTVQE